MASQREYEMLFRLNAQMHSGYSSTFKNAQSAVAQFQKEYQNLSKSATDISGFQRQQTAVENTKTKLSLLQQQYDNIQREMQETGTYSSDLENKLLAKKAMIDKTSDALQQQIDKLNAYKQKLSEAGVDTGNLESESARLREELDNLREGFSDANESAEKSGKALSGLEGTIAALGIVKLLKEIYDAFSACVNAAIEFESAMTGVAKTTDLTDEEFAAMSKAIQDLSTDIPVTTTELAAVAETAGQLGIAKENLLDFATVMSMLSTATTMSADEAATMLAQFANITQMDPAEYKNLASAIVYLGNNSATTEQKITDLAQGIAASGDIAGMSEADIVGIAAAVSSLSIEAQAGSTSISKLITMLMKAVQTGDGLAELANVAGMTASEFKVAWEQDAAGALASFVTGLGDVDRLGQTAIMTLEDLGITEIRMQSALLKLSNSGNTLTNAISSSNEAWEQNSALVDEANKRYATTESQQILMQNSFNNLKVTIGEQFMPVLNDLYAMAADLFADVAEFIENNPEVVRAIAALAIGFGALVAILAVAKIAMIAFNAICSANPVLLVAAGVTALVTALATFIVSSSASTKESEELSYSSRQQAEHIAELNEQYRETCETMGETSAEAQLLKDEIDQVTESFEANKQTAEELDAAHRAIIDSHNELMGSYNDTIAEIGNETASVESLMTKLEDLMAVEGKSAEAKQEILAVVELLNEAMPELGLSYDQYADSLNMSADAIRDVIRAELEREANEEKRAQLKALIAEESGLYEQLQANIAETTAAEENLAEAQAASAQARANAGTPVGEAGGRAYATAIAPYITEVKSAQAEVDKLAAKELESQTAYNENQTEIEKLSSELATYTEETEAAGQGMEEMTSFTDELNTRLDELGTAYTAAYDAAYESISGQYSMWETAADIVPMSIDAINKALQSQLEYWGSYDTSIATIQSMTGEVEGLSNVLATLDGSEESVNFAAGLAEAIDQGDVDKVEELVTNWNALQEQQKKTSEDLASLQTDYEARSDEIMAYAEDTVKDMDLSATAAESGMNTIQGYIDGATDMLPAVTAAYSDIGEAAINAIEKKMDINSPSKVMEWEAQMTIAGYINQTKAMRDDVTEAMDYSIGGALSYTREAIGAAPMGSGSAAGGSVVIHFAPVYELAGATNAEELRSILMAHDEEMKEQIREILEEERVNAARRAYA